MGAERLSDGDLSRKCRQGDPNAWRELLRRLGPLVYRVAVRMLGPTAEAEDASQETFMRIHRSFNTFDPTRPLAPWAAHITYNVCLKKLGKKSTQMQKPTDPETFTHVQDDRNPGPEEQAAGSEASDMLLMALDRLAAQDRVLVNLRYREGMSDAEVAESTGMPVGTVKTRLHRARGRLKKFLAPMLGREA